ncbi:MAG: outer membrane beta-barrel protein [Inquilinus sp.]|nr:outer membrane beta-barrel protein [Inquilinus sp.]
MLVLAGRSPAEAADWTLEAFASERVAYDDNVGFTRTGEISDESSRTTLGFDIDGGTEVLDLSLVSRFDFTYYSDESGLDSNDQRLVGNFGYRPGELSRLGLDVEYDRDTTRTSEEDDTGRFIFDNIRREAFEVRPSWSYQATRVDRFSLAGEYRTVDYESDLVDYDRYGGALDWTHDLTRSSALGVSAFGARVESDTVDNRESDIYGLEFGLTSEATPQLRLQFGVGVFRAETATDLVAGQSTTGFLPSAGLEFRVAPEAVLELAYARTVAPSGGGNIVERDTVDLTYRQDWSETVSLGLDARYRAQDRVFDDGTAGRDFVRAEPSVEWRMTETWSLRAAYRYRWQSFDDEDGDSVSNAGLVTLTYRPMGWSLGG